MTEDIDTLRTEVNRLRRENEALRQQPRTAVTEPQNPYQPTVPELPLAGPSLPRITNASTVCAPRKEQGRAAEMEW